MNKKFKKIVCAFAVSGIILVALHTRNVKAANLIEDTKRRQNIGSGVEYVEIDRFTEDGFIDIDVLKLETKNSFSYLIPLINQEGVSNRATLSQMIDQSQALAGINGDFFEVTNYPMALGSLVGEEKVILTTPEAAFSRNSFYITKDGQSGVGGLSNDITVTINGQVLNVNALNKLSKPYKSLSILDSNWGQNSPGKSLGANNVELLIANGKIIDKRVGGNPMTIIPGTHVLTQVGENLEAFNIGDSVEINFGSYSNLKFSIGGGNILVNNGQVSTSKSLSKTKSPRTAIGINQDNSILYLVTVDGRNNSSIGMNELEFAEFLRSIGVYKGLNLDGGGSTTMGIKYSGSETTSLVNKPSDGRERQIVSGVGIKTNAPVSDLAYLVINPGVEDMFAGFSYPIKLEGFDQYHNKIQLNQDQIKLSSDFGSFANGNFTPTQKGKATINATYGGLTAQTQVHTHSNIQEILLDVDYLQISNGKVHIFETIYGKDDQGYRKKLDASILSFTMSEGLGSLEGNKFTAKKEGSAVGTITANFNGIKRIIPVTVGHDVLPVENFTNLENIQLTVNPEDPQFMYAQVNPDPEMLESGPTFALGYTGQANENNKSVTMDFINDLDLGNSNHIGLWVKGDGANDNLKVTYRDLNGKTSTQDLVAKMDFADWKYVEAIIPKGLGQNIYLDKISLNIQTKGEQGSLLKFGGLVSAIKKPIDWSLAQGSNTLVDHKNYLVTEGQPTIATIASLNKNGGNEGKLGLMQNKSAAIIFNGASQETLNQINSGLKFNGNDVHNIKKIPGFAFITLETDQNGIRSKNPGQWKPFLEELDKEENKNLVILMQKDPETLPGQKEKAFFFKNIDEAVKNGKNVFIVLPGDKNTITMVDGYRKVHISPNANSVLNINLLNGNMSYALVAY